MSAIEPQFGIRTQKRWEVSLIQPLQTCRPANSDEAALNGLVADAEALQINGGGDSRAGIDDLMPAYECGLWQIEQIIFGLHHQTGAQEAPGGDGRTVG